MDIALALSHMRQPCEAVPRSADNFDWSRKAASIMGCNPTASGVPSWYPYEHYETWPRAMAWFTVYRQAGSAPAVNTRVEVRNLQLWVKSKASGRWVQLDAPANPAGGACYPENQQGASQPWVARVEQTGGLSVSPPREYCAHGWGTMRDIDPSDVAGIAASIDHRVVLDDPTGADTRMTDRWCANVGVDYYPPAGAPKLPYYPGAFSGRYLISTSDWRTSMGAVQI